MTSLDTTYRSLLKQALKHDPGPLTLTKLHGDASNRTYYRVTSADASTSIVMQLPDGPLSASEEITNFKGEKDELPFLNIGRFLAQHGMPVPQVLGFDPKTRSLLLEDLGSTPLEVLVSNTSPKARRQWYQKAIDLLLQWQSLSLKDPLGCYALMRSFDETLFNWEFDHFFEYGIEKRLKITMTAPDQKILTEWSRRFSHELTTLPQVLVHRDFQSRNLMVKEGKLYLIDFQDALIGPYVYDLTSLLRDSYVELDPQTLQELLQYYCQNRGLPASADFMTHFDLMTLQRKLKDAGRFIYIDRVKGNPAFLKSFPVSLRYARSALERHPE